MNILFRCDGSRTRGTGHVMRCLSLAAQLQSQDHTCTFACRGGADALLAYITKAGHTVLALPAPETETGTEEIWTEAAQSADLDLMKAALPTATRYDWIIVDHYGLDARWEQAARPLCHGILVIDDIANRPHDCDLLLDQNEIENNSARYKNLVPANCILLTGGEYALLRNEFAQARPDQTPRRDPVRNILVLMGGADPKGVALRISTILAPYLKSMNIQANVIVGSLNPYAEALKALAATESAISVLIEPPGIPGLMAEADLAFGAGGTTTWEFCCMGTPLLILSLADNQIEIARNAQECGFARYIGHAAQTADTQIEQVFLEAVQDRQIRHSMSQAGYETVDGLGCVRVVNCMTAAVIELRPATISDSDDILRWRNDQLTRQMSFQQDAVSREVHDAWFKDRLDSQDSIFLIAELKGQNVGSVRYEIAGSEAHISISIDPAYRGKSMGRVLLQKGDALLPRTVKQVVAKIKPTNAASIKAFENAGYITEASTSDYITYLKRLRDSVN